MSEKAGSRRLVVLVCVVAVAGGVVVWQALSRSSSGQPSSEAATKAEELTRLYEQTGLSTEVPEDNAENVEPVDKSGPQSVDD